MMNEPPGAFSDISEAILRSALADPDRLAVVAGDGTWTYRELLLHSLAVRNAVSGLVPVGEPVVVLAQRTRETIAAIVGLLLAERAFAPVDPNDPDPAARLTNFTTGALLGRPTPDAALRDAAAQVIDISRRTNGPHPLDVRDPSPTSLAYTLLTSGTTGRSKIVEVTRGNLTWYVNAIRDRLGIKEPMHWAMVSSFAADLGYTGVFVSLATGGTLHVLGEHERRDPRALRTYLTDRGIDVLKITPTHYRACFNHASTIWGRPLRLLIFGGERLSPSLVRHVFAGGVAERVVNHYGPAETTIGVACLEMRSAAEIPGGTASVPIGTALSGVSLSILDRFGRPVSAGTAGELVVSGPAVSRGYRGNTSRTAEKFVDLEDGQRAYRTGDLCRVSDNAFIEVLGRADTEVKVRGWRVDPLAVEDALRAIPGVQDAAVIPSGPTDRARLCALAVTDLGGDVLTALLDRRLPSHFVPTEIVVVDRLPLLANGKLDTRRARQLLRGPAITTMSSGVEDADPLHTGLRLLWAQQLGADDVGLDEDFFAAGGDSVGAIQLLGRVQSLGHKLRAEAFLRQPTVRRVAEAIRLLEPAAREEGSAAPIARSNHLSAPQQWFLDRGFSQPNRWCQAIILDCEERLEPSRLEGALRALVAEHPLLRTRFAAADASWFAELVAAPGTLLDIVAEPDLQDDTRVAAAFEVALSHIDITNGSVFRAVLVGGGATDQLVLVAHHLVIDGISWRIALDDLARHYARGPGPATSLSRDQGSFWDWAARQPEQRPSAPATAAGTEANAATAWIELDVEATKSLQQAAATKDVGVDGAVLAALAWALASRGNRIVRVDVEDHGRRDPPKDLDLTRVIGWFTRIDLRELDLRDVNDVFGALDVVTAASQTDHDTSRTTFLPSADVCFNHLGTFIPPGGGQIGWDYAGSHAHGIRGLHNQLVHPLTLTSRVLGGCLVVDIHYSRRHLDDSEAGALLGEIRTALSSLAGRSRAGGRSSEGVWLDRRTSSGFLALRPRELGSRSVSSTAWAPSVLLTGATGFLGCFLLREILEQPGATATCIVRSVNADAGRRRLAARLRWHFGPNHGLDLHRVSVVAGDVTVPMLGLDATQYNELVVGIDTVIHSAADVRLFTDTAVPQRVNVGGTSQIISFTEAGAPKDLHLISTLSVAGAWTDTGVARFSEVDRDIGQDFRNEYERTKLEAETLVAAHAARGGAVRVHRVGSLTGAVDASRRQFDLVTNRIAQSLATYVHTGIAPDLPDEQLFLVPVDQCARAIIKIASMPILVGRTFHLAGTAPYGHNDVVDQLRLLGHPVETLHPSEFVLRCAESPAHAVASWSAMNSPRRIHLESGRTVALLDSLGLEFRSLTDIEWSSRIVGDALEACSGRAPDGVVPPTTPPEGPF